jgi:hypothetical protein
MCLLKGVRASSATKKQAAPSSADSDSKEAGNAARTSAAGASAEVYDTDETLCRRLFAVLNTERTEKQRAARRLAIAGTNSAGVAFHTLNAEQLKHSAYSSVCSRIAESALALLQFKTSAEPDSVLARGVSARANEAKSTAPASSHSTTFEAASTSDTALLGMARSTSIATDVKGATHAPAASSQLPSLTRAQSELQQKSGASSHASLGPAVLDDRLDEMRRYVDEYQRWKTWQNSRRRAPDVSPSDVDQYVFFLLR